MARTTLVSTPADSDTVGDARDWLVRNLGHGVMCPVCGQNAKVYRRKINSGMAKSLILIFRIAGEGWIHVRVIGAKSREEGKLAYWGLLEEQRAARPDGGRAGYWRLTRRGVLYVRGQLAVPKYAVVYDGQCLSFEGPQVKIQDALGTEFNYADLMAGR